jgi:glycosyltransferase involved in cell wall biosynthesis
MPAWLSAATIATSVVIDRRALWANSANKVFDALAAGKPVAINHEGWLAALIRQSGCGLVLQVGNVAAAATTLARSIRDSRWLAGSAAAARRLARERFDRDRLAAQLELVLADAAGVPRPARAVRIGAAEMAGAAVGGFDGSRP